MPFFKAKPNVSDGEKARIEFHVQQIIECVGFERSKLPVKTMGDLSSTTHTVEQIVGATGHHLGHNTTGIQTVVVPQDLEKCGGGG